MTSAFLDASVLVRYFAEDDVPRAAAAARLIDGPGVMAVSTGVLIETLHVLRTQFDYDNPALGTILARFLARENVDLVDADKSGVLRALAATDRLLARRIPDALIVQAAARANVDFIATFDENLRTPLVPVRML